MPNTCVMNLWINMLEYTYMWMLYNLPTSRIVIRQLSIDCLYLLYNN